jgi:hypothetical protein
MYAKRNSRIVVVIDVTPASDKVDMYNYVGKLRGASHVKALTFAELLEMLKACERLLEMTRCLCGKDMSID